MVIRGWQIPRPCSILLIGALLCQRHLGAQQPRSATAEQHFEEAMAAEDRGDLARAESLLVELHRTRPGDFSVDESLGLLYAQRGDYVRALPELKTAAKEQPSSDVAHANLGAALYKMQRLAEAASELKRAVALNPSNEQAWVSLGRVRMDENHPAQAARALIAATRLDQTNEDLRLDCASAMLAAHDSNGAAEQLKTIQNPDGSARAQLLLGELAEEQKDFAAAASHMTRAVDMEPSEENAWALGEELLRHWTFPAAAVEFEAASRKYPESVRLRAGLGAAYFGDMKYALAIPVFAELLSAYPNNATYASMLGVSCEAVTEVARPRCTALVQYAQSHLSDARASIWAAQFLLRKGGSESERPTAESLIRAALKADPKLPEAQFSMGSFLQDDGRWAESIPYLERAVSLRPEYAQAHYHLALACWRTGRKDEGRLHMDLQKKYSHEEQEERDSSLKRIVTFVVSTGPPSAGEK